MEGAGMKKKISIILIFAVVLSLFSGYGTKTAYETLPSKVLAAEKSLIFSTSEENPEIQQLVQQSWVPAAIRQNLNETIRWNEMLEMLTNVIYLCDASALGGWNAICRPNVDKMQRDDGMLAIYEAACALGIGHQAREGWGGADVHYTTQGVWKTGFSPRQDVFTNVHEICPYESNPGWKPTWDYFTGAKLYSLGQSSAANAEPFFDHVEAGKGFNDMLTRKEALLAASKLKQAYEVTKSGGYSIEKTNWDDPLLAGTKAVRDAILNSPTTISKGKELVLGATYTGKAYYVSNSGNDRNDGLSPQTAWATLEKVEKATLNHGDAVFFQRGGIWYGRLTMQNGVTYSAYGEGPKPILTGCPLDTNRPEKWNLYAVTADGGMIWQYAEPVADVGVILLNGGEMVARKAYPLWNGKEYTNAKGEPYIIEKELADLMFFSKLELTGERAQIGYPVGQDELKIFGPLYLRCDAGNPAEVYNSIEMTVLPAGNLTSEKGWNTLDNLHFRGYTGRGIDANNRSNLVYQNCEVEWCGGGIASYQPSVYDSENIRILVSGGGMLLFGTNIIARNNYVHDCENKGLAVVINGTDGNPAWLNRFNIVAERNVVEHCGSSVYMMIEFVHPGLTWRFENIRFAGNMFVNGGYGWRQRNFLGLESDGNQLIKLNNVRPTGEILFEGNLFYRAAGTLINCCADDYQNEASMPTMRGNIYVQDKGQLLFEKRDEKHGAYLETTLATSDQVLMEKCVREYLGDVTGQVLILE